MSREARDDRGQSVGPGVISARSPAQDDAWTPDPMAAVAPGDDPAAGTREERTARREAPLRHHHPLPDGRLTTIAGFRLSRAVSSEVVHR